MKNYLNASADDYAKYLLSDILMAGIALEADTKISLQHINQALQYLEILQKTVLTIYKANELFTYAYLRYKTNNKDIETIIAFIDRNLILPAVSIDKLKNIKSDDILMSLVRARVMYFSPIFTITTLKTQLQAAQDLIQNGGTNIAKRAIDKIIQSIFSREEKQNLLDIAGDC